MENLIKTQWYTLFHTSFGWCGIVFGIEGIKMIYLPEPQKEKLKKKLFSCFRNAEEGAHRIKGIIGDISNYFKGENVHFNYVLDLKSMTYFQKKLYRETMKISYGNTRCYNWLAEKVGISGGARAIGNALGKNPLPLLIPCHRVIRKNGMLGGFSSPGGIILKKKMLLMEGALAKV